LAATELSIIVALLAAVHKVKEDGWEK